MGSLARMTVDLTVLAIPGFLGAMAAELAWQRRHPAGPGERRAGDYELKDTIASLTSSIAALRAVDEIGWIDSGLNILGFALFTLAAIGLGRRMRLSTTTPAIVKDTP